jgi:(1->4)-alpha-D-glucan 1-alpha-D-glucosylmutase
VLTHRQDDLREKLTLESPDYQKFLNITTALRNLPPRTEKNPERIAARFKEKEVVKNEIRALYNASTEFRAFVDENVLIFNGTPGEPESFDLLDRLLSAQAFRLSFWRVATEEINYRRFFDINDLGAIRMEDEQVFDECHRLVFNLIREGHVTGLRVDHPDGLHDPAEYFRRLQEGCFAALCTGKLGEQEAAENIRNIYHDRLAENPEGGLRKPFFIIGEKILMESERLSPEWPIFGTTGYGFMNSVNAVLIDSTSARAADKNYTSFTKQTAKFSELFYAKKKLIMETSMSSEINVLGHSLNRISERDRHYRDFTLNNLIDAIVELIAFFPVYRTYITPSGVSETDRRYIEAATSKAKRKSREINPQVFDFIRDVLLLEYPRKEDQELRRECLDFTMKFQQLTGPVMAKGIEDTAFYNYNRLMSLNEVGGNPERLGMTVEAFHGQNIERHKHKPRKAGHDGGGLSRPEHREAQALAPYPHRHLNARLQAERGRKGKGKRHHRTNGRMARMHNPLGQNEQEVQTQPRGPARARPQRGVPPVPDAHRRMARRRHRRVPVRRIHGENKAIHVESRKGSKDQLELA